MSKGAAKLPIENITDSDLDKTFVVKSKNHVSARPIWCEIACISTQSATKIDKKHGNPG